MKIKEVIESLQNHDPETDVCGILLKSKKDELVFAELNPENSAIILNFLEKLFSEELKVMYLSYLDL